MHFSTLCKYIIATYLNLSNILNALTMINLFFKGFNPHGEMYFSINTYTLEIFNDNYLQVL